MFELARSLPVGSARNGLLANVRHFVDLSPDDQEEGLVEMVLDLEDRILAQPDAHLDRDTLRANLYEPFGRFLSDPRFIRLITPRLRIQRCILFLQDVVADALDKSGALLGGVLATQAWLEYAPDNTCPPVPLGVADELPTDDAGWLRVLTLLTERVLEHMRSTLNEEKVRELVLNALDVVSSQHGGSDACGLVRNMVPPWALADHSQVVELPNQASEQAIGRIALIQVRAGTAQKDDPNQE